jgi:hypothetical protein
MPELHHIGRVTYEAFRDAVKLANAGEDVYPPWPDLPTWEQAAWQAAGVAARDDRSGPPDGANMPGGGSR